MKQLLFFHIANMAVLLFITDMIAQEKADSIYQLKNVIVTVSRTEAKDISLPALISVKKFTDIRIPGIKNYFETLSKDPGIKINSRQDNAIFNDIDVRGLSGNATSGTNLLVILDGIPQRRLSYGGPYLGALPSEAVTRMEMMKGPASSLYGRYALAGVLQLSTDPVSDNFSSDITTSYDDLSGGVQSAFRASGMIISPLSAALTVNTSSSRGWRPNNSSKRKEGYLNLNYRFNDKNSLKLLLGYIDAFEEIAAPVFIDSSGNLKNGFNRNTNIAVPNQNNLSLKETRIASIWNQKINNELSLNVKTSYWDAGTFNRVGRPDDQPDAGTLVARSSSNRDWNEYVFFNEAEAIYIWQPAKEVIINTAAGGSYEKLNWYQKQTNIGITGTNQNIPLDLAAMSEPDPQKWIYTIMPDKVTNENDYGIFLKTHLSLKDFDFHLGLRYDGFTRTQYNPENPNILMKLNNSALSPNIGCIVGVYKKDGNIISIYGGYGKGFSPVYRAVSSTAFAHVLPELSENIEFGIKTSFKDNFINAQAAFFNIERQNVVVINPADNLPVNGGEWNNKGIEVAIKIIPNQNYFLYSSTAISFSRIRSDVNNPKNIGNKIPLNAGNIFSAGIEFRDISIYQNKQTTLMFEGGIDYQFVSQRYGNEKNSFILPGYQLLNANGNIKYNNNITLGFYIRNIFNELYLTTMFSGVKNGSAFVGQPRAFGLSCQISIAGGQ